MTQHTPLKIGIIGAGGIAQHYHIPSYLRAGAQIVAACDVNQEALDVARDITDIEHTYQNYEEMLTQEDLDIVSICTSNDMHYPVVMAAIEAGVDIYCEKPLALTYAQAQEMYQAAQAAGIKTGVNFSHRRTPASRMAKEIVDSGALGDIYYVSAVYAAGWPGYAERPGSWRNQREKAGFGGMGDMGSHVIDMMRWWLSSDIISVTAQMATFVPERTSVATGESMQVTTEDQGMVLARYDNGAMGYICGSYTFTGRGYDQRAEIYGSEGGLMYNQQRPYELSVHLPPEFVDEYVVLREGGTADTPYTTIRVPERHLGLDNGPIGARRTVLMDFIDAYRDAVESDKPFAFSPSFYEGLKVQEVLEGARRGETSRCWVSLPL